MHPIHLRCNHSNRPRAMFQFPTRRFIVRSRKVSMPRDLCSESCYRSSIWQAPRQQCCRRAYQILKRCDNLDYRLPTTDLRHFTRSYDKTSCRILKQGPSHIKLWNTYSGGFCGYLDAQIEEILCRLPQFGTKDKFHFVCVCQFHIHKIHLIGSSSGKLFISYQLISANLHL